MSAYDFSDIPLLPRVMTQQDLAWYNPPPRDKALRDHNKDTFKHLCETCDVLWYEIDPVPTRPKCFVCGRFVKRIDSAVYFTSSIFHPWIAAARNASNVENIEP